MTLANADSLQNDTKYLSFHSKTLFHVVKTQHASHIIYTSQCFRAYGLLTMHCCLTKGSLHNKEIFFRVTSQAPRSINDNSISGADSQQWFPLLFPHPPYMLKHTPQHQDKTTALVITWLHGSILRHFMVYIIHWFNYIHFFLSKNVKIV